MRRAWRRLCVLLVVAAGAAAACACGTAGPAAGPAAGRTYRIGITQLVTHPALDEAVAGFKEGLAGEGFTAVDYDAQNAEGDVATAVTIAQKFAYEDLDLVYAVATPATQAVTRLIKETPVVFCAVTDPVGAGIVADLVHPGGNVTGVSNAQQVKPILELVRRLEPHARRIGVVFNPGEVNSAFMVRRLEAAAKPLGLTVVEAGVTTSAEVRTAAESLVGRVDAVVSLNDNTASSAFEAIVKVCDDNDIPLFSGDADNVRRGAAAGYAFDYEDLGRLAGRQAAAVLSGEPPGDIPVAFARDLQLFVNRRAAEAQGLGLPQDLLAQAAHIY